MDSILQGAFAFRVVAFLALPGLMVRKIAMTAAALFSGATVTGVNAYKLDNDEIEFNAEGISSVARVLVPLAPLFACVIVLQAINGFLGTPMSLSYEPPGVSHLDAGGAKGFLLGLWDLMSGLVRQFVKADWGSLRLYILLAFLFSLSLGASVSFTRLREAFLGVVLVCLVMAASAALLGGGGGLWSVRAESPAARTQHWIQSATMETGGMALVMMLGGMLAALCVGLLARLLAMAGKAVSGKASGGKTSGGKGEKASKKSERQAA
jgi:small-conductance mechanosensitive channel